MACSYRFNGKEFSNKKELSEYIQNNIDEIPSDVILELLDTASESALFAEREANLFGGSEFTNISDDGLSSMSEPITYESVKALMDKERNAKLKSIAPRLTDFTNKLGVSVEFIKEDGVNGVARIADGVIAISIGQDMTDAYYEEMSHMLRERFKDRLSAQELSDFVKSSAEYAKYSDEYRMVYQSEGIENEELERKVELEVFDKILASELKNELTGTDYSSENQGGLWDTIRQWLREFIDWARNTGGKDARSVMRSIVSAVRNNDVSQFSNNNFEFQSYYSLSDNLSQQVKDIANDLSAGWNNAIASIRQSEGSEAVINIIESQIYGYGQGNGEETNRMIDSYISQTYRLLGEINREVDNLDKEKFKILPKDLALFAYFSNTLIDTLPNIKKTILSGDLIGLKNKDSIEIVAKKVDELAINVENLKAIYDKYSKDFALKQIDIEQNAIGTSKEIIKEMRASIQDGVTKDVGFFQRWLFSEYSSSNVVSGLFHKLRAKMVRDYRAETTNAITEISSELDKLGITGEQFNTLIEKGKDGQATGFTINPYARDFINEIEIEKIADEIDPNILDKEAIKSLRDGTKRKSELNEKQKELYEYALNKVNNEMTEKPFIDAYYQAKDEEMEANIKSAFPGKTEDEVRKLKKAISIKTSPLYGKKARILAKYIKPTANETRLDILSMTDNDKLSIDEIDAEIKSLSQTYNGIGAEKQEESAEIAKVLRYSLENYKAQEEDALLTSEYSDYLDKMIAEKKSLYQVLKATGSISFSEEDSINTALHELGTYKIFRDSAVLQMINAYLPDGKKLTINTLSTENKLTDAENKKVKEAISTLKEIRKSMGSPYKKFGELKIGEGGLNGTTLAKVAEMEEVFKLIKTSQVLSKEEKEMRDSQGIGFIPTDNFYNDYGFMEVDSIADIENSDKRLDSKKRPLTYVITGEGGVQKYYKRDEQTTDKGLKVVATNVDISPARLEIKRKFERKHMMTLSESNKLVPKFYYTKVVNERKISYFKGDRPFTNVDSPKENVVYVSSTNEKHFIFSGETETFSEVDPPNKQKGERYVTFGGKTFLVNIKPNSIWKGKQGADKYINPNYNETIGNKTKQYKRVVNFRGRPVSTLNDAYFTKFGISKDDIFGEATANVNLFKAMNIVLQNDYVRLKKIGAEQDLFFRPQVRIKPDELLYTKGGLKNAAKAWLETNIFSNIQDVDEMNNVNASKEFSVKDGKQRKRLMDNYNVRIDPTTLTNNLLSSYFTRTEMAVRYDHRAKNLVQADILMNIAKDIERLGDKSNVYGSMQDNYVSDFFGAVHSEIGTMKFGDKIVSITKGIQTSRGFIATRALGFNKYTAISSAVGGWIARQKESFVGQYGTREDYKFATDTISYMGMARDTGSRITKEKILRIAEFMDIVDFKDILMRAGRSETINKISSLADQFSFLRAGDMGRIAESAIIGLLQFRKIDGQWYSRDTFLEKSVNTEKRTMSEANMIWNANHKNALYYEVMKYYNEDTNTLKIGGDKEIQRLFDRASAIGKKHHTDLTGNIKGEDSPTAFRKPLAAPLGMFKNFLFNALQNRFHDEVPGSSITGAKRKGSYRYVQMNKEWAKLIAFAILNLQSKINNPNNGLTYQEMQALRRIQMDLYVTLSFLAIAMVLSSLADDDEYEDNWVVQAAAFSAVKTFGEVSSGDIYSLPFQGLEIMKSPYNSYVTLMKDVKGLTLGGEDINQGSFKGYDKRVASAIKLAPMGFSNIYNLIGDDAERSRRNMYRDSWVWGAYKMATEE
jgi:hypothetical protein